MWEEDSYDPVILFMIVIFSQLPFFIQQNFIKRSLKIRGFWLEADRIKQIVIL